MLPLKTADLINFLLNEVGPEFLNLALKNKYNHFSIPIDDYSFR